MTTTSTEVSEIPQILNPISGELVPVSDLKEVAAVIDLVRQRKAFFDSALAAITEALAQQSKVNGSRTFNAGGGTKIVLSGDTEIQWDVTKLNELRDAGLPEDRMSDLVSEVVTYKVNASVAKQIAASNPDYKAIIESAAIRVPKRQYARVELA